jgi:hypothetical protein
VVFGIISYFPVNLCFNPFLRYLSSWVSNLSFSHNISNVSHFFVACFNLTKSEHARYYTSWFMITCNLCRALDGICDNTNWIWLKSFKGVCPMISSMRNILGVMWNVAFDCSIVWTGSLLLLPLFPLSVVLMALFACYYMLSALP